jgi:hypothetical protein
MPFCIRFLAEKWNEHGGVHFFMLPARLIATYYLHHSHKFSLLLKLHEFFHSEGGGLFFTPGIYFREKM